MDPRGTEKKERLLSALNQGMVMVHLDARRPGVMVPQQLRTEAHLRLNLSYRFDPPDLSVNEWGVRQTLSFGGSRFGVAIPWSALFAITSHATKEFWMFLEDLPPELLQTASPARAPEAAPAPRPIGRPQLRTVPLPGEGDEEEAPVAPTPLASAPLPSPELVEPPPQNSPTERGPDEPQPPKPSRNHLRVVK